MSSKSRDGRMTSKFQSASLLAGVSLVAMMTVAAPAMAQDQATAPAADDDVVIITGFRGSLQSSINAKKKDDSMVDVIKAEDIGQFPDLNLAESLQRIPGVSIDRDGGEGRTITVRGLNSEFSRTRLNGLEAMATTGGKDSSGGTNRGRGFDYNVFAADLFNSITVRKSLAAEVEEGSLGATVDLQTARPFDYKGFTMAVGGEVGYNTLAKDTSPRGTFLISNRWADGKMGALLSVAWGKRTVVETGANTTRWENAYGASTSGGNANSGRFAGYYDAANVFHTITPCSPSGNQCNSATNTTSTNTAAGDATAVNLSNALHPRIPRYNYFSTDQKRLGVTGSFQMRPNENTLISLDGMYADFSADRDEWEVEAISFSRNGQGTPKTKVRSFNIDASGALTKGTFDNVDIRSEHRFDALDTQFTQLNLAWDQTWTDKLSSKVLIGASKSVQDTPEQTTFTLESYDVQGYSYDYTNMTEPTFNYGTSSTGCTPDQACYWTFSTSTSKGDSSVVRLRPQSVENDFSTAKVDLIYDFSDNLTFKAGLSKKTYKFNSIEAGRYTGAATGTRNEGAGTTEALMASTINTGATGINSDYAQTVTVAGNTFLIPNLNAFNSKFDYNCNCTNTYGIFTVNSLNATSRNSTRTAQEDDTASYLQMDFKGSLGAMPFRGNLGVRRVETSLSASGYVSATWTTVERKYSDTLPALNFMVEPVENVYVRFAASKTMARPTLLSLTPGGGSISTTPGSEKITTGNPYLDPVRANNLDLSVEWYMDKDTLLTAAVFEKDITSYIQQVNDGKKLSELGYDPADFDVATGAAEPVFAFTTYKNTPGGKLKGWEVNLQKPFTFLPGLLANTGGILNFTNVESKIQYFLTPSATTATTANLLGLSPQAYNATLYYEGPALSGRVSLSHRDGYLTQLNPGSTAAFLGKNASTNIDAQMTWKMNKSLTFILEGVNLTNEPDDRYVSYDTPQGNVAPNLLYDNSTSGTQYYAGFRYKY